jgi:hypothetical protein
VAEEKYQLGKHTNNEKKIERIERIPQGRKVAYPSLSSHLTEIPPLSSFFEHHLHTSLTAD